MFGGWNKYSNKTELIQFYRTNEASHTIIIISLSLSFYVYVYAKILGKYYVKTWMILETLIKHDLLLISWEEKLNEWMLEYYHVVRSLNSNIHSYIFISLFLYSFYIFTVYTIPFIHIFILSFIYSISLLFTQYHSFIYLSFLLFILYLYCLNTTVHSYIYPFFYLFFIFTV